MKDLLKEAIADAKAVRETALANAKLALEEAFTPRLQSMLSARLAEEADEDTMEEEEEETSMKPKMLFGKPVKSAKPETKTNKMPLKGGKPAFLFGKK